MARHLRAIAGAGLLALSAHATSATANAWTIVAFASQKSASALG